MAVSPFYVSIHIQNHLMTDLTRPVPHIIHGVLNDNEWPTILRGKTSDEIRINALNAHDGVQGHVKYTSNVGAYIRPVTFFFICNEYKNSASTMSGHVVSRVASASLDPPLVVTYDVQELVD